MAKVFESYQLHAYVDGQLSREECLEIEHEMQLQPELEQQICELRAMKSQVKEMYQDIPTPEAKLPIPSVKQKGSLPKAMAASLILGVLIGAGSLHWYSSGSSQTVMQNNQFSQQLVANRYLVHLDSEDEQKQFKALQEVASILEQGGNDVQVDFISNYKGITLFDVNNPNKAELESLLAKYDNLALYACKRALERARDKGKPVQLIPQVNFEQPAIDAVAKRLTQGWQYIKI